MSDDPRGDAGRRDSGSLEATRTNIQGTARLQDGERVGDRYLILGMLGMGAMGVVYRARDEDLGVEVALKVLRAEYAGDETLLERFRREIILARQVTHKNVVRIHDLGRDGDLVYLTMDLVDGRSLRSLLEEEDRLPHAQVAELGTQLADALAAAHDKEVVHRDLKPSNVMVDSSGNAYITDFGVARSIAAPGLTQTGFIVGTPHYLSPEQVRGEELDGRSDIYALGVLLFELVSGQPPSSGKTADETLAQHLRGVPQTLPGLPNEVPRALRAILQRCLEPDRRRRYQTAAEVRDDLATMSRPPWQLPAVSRLGKVAAFSALVALLGGSAVLVWRATGRTEVGTAEDESTALVILPFADETGQPELAWLAPGVPELLFESLVQQPDLRLVSPQRVIQAVSDLKLEPGTMSENTLQLAGGLFDSSRLVTGSVRGTAEGGLRIDAKLVNPTTGLGAAKTLHAEVPASPDSASLVVAAFEKSLLERLSLPQVESSDKPLSSVALPVYTEATRLLWQGDAIGARDRLEQAVVQDPAFGPGWLRLAQAYEAAGQYQEAVDAADRAVAALEQESGGSERLRLLAVAQRASLSGEPDRAQEVLKELVAAYPADIESAIALADAFGREGKFGESLELLAEIVARAPANAQAWFLRAKYSILSGQSRQAVDDFLVRAMVLQNKLKNPQGQADVLNAFGVGYRELGEMEQAEDSYRRAAELRRELGDRRGYATTLRNLAQISIFRGKHAEAEENLMAAKEIFDELGDQAGAADIYNELGMMEEARSAYERSLEHFRQALQIRRNLGDRRAIAESLNNIGFANHQLGRLDDASVYWQQALDIYTETENVEGQVAVRQSLGQLDITRGEWPEAQKQFLAALESARQLGWEAAIAASQGFLGRTAQFQGRYAAAFDHYEDALGRFTELGDSRGYTEFALARAEARIELEDPVSALDLLAAIEEKLDASASHDHRAEFARLRSLALKRRGEESSGVAQALEEARAAAKASGNKVLGSKVRLAASTGKADVDTHEALWREARELEDARLVLETGVALASARFERGQVDEAERVLSSLERVLRRSGESALTHRILELRARVAESRGLNGESWRQKREVELERITEGLADETVQLFRRSIAPDREYANAA